ncbi:Peptidase family M23 [Sulfitobacter sp. THAF37]|uniref:M23 family metallopeptidase n=1 Tax=Sulfitobacter sp. THAF37 TaxID=2587855 RepID=UPI001267D216|nr:M23 family metallopeptidase [Sulfitobacter sp. THAF37]QFT57493.1 Peptidase family M23 [Sulfitobacter sp. THAF37]
MILRGVIAIALPFAGPALAEGLLLQSPVACAPTDSCYIQQYMDRDPGPGAVDFTCAELTYDGHKGTDFALPTRAGMAAGVDVMASAPGVVRGVRDGMDDTGYTPERRDELAGRECGNGVVISHDNGWETQYCHLKQGSVTVVSGQTVGAGTVLGQIGQSGNAAFPHVHLSVRDADGTPVDPFDPDGRLDCDDTAGETLWADPPAYRPGGLLTLGFSDAIPDYALIKDGDAAADSLPVNAPALVIFAYFFGPRAGDTLRLDITGPEGQVIADEIALTRPQAQAFRAIGKRRSSTPWPEGSYTGTAELVRDGTALDSRTVQITLR